MAVLVVPHVVQVSAYGTVSGRAWASVWHLQNAPAWWELGAPVSEVARDFANNWQDHVMTILTNNVILTGFQYLSLDSADGTTGVLAPDAAKRTVGAGTSTPLPPNNCILVRKSGGTSRGARSGRAYLPGVAEASVDPAGIIAAATVTGIQGAMNSFFDGLDTPSGDASTQRHLAIVHRPPSARIKGPQVVVGTSSRVEALMVDSVIATQRRRLRG